MKELSIEYLRQHNFGEIKRSKIDKIYHQFSKSNKYNISQKSGFELEIYCLGDINFKKYIQNIYDRVELISIFDHKEGERYNNSKPEHQKRISELKKSLEENPGEYNKYKKKFEEQVSRRVVYIMNNNRKLFPLISNKKFEETAEIVEKSQRKDRCISDPATNFANDLHASLAIALNLENFKNLEFYISTQTHLDAFAIDAWFKYKHIDENNNEKSVRVFFDLTSKTEEQKKLEYEIKEENGGKVLSDLILSMPEKEKYNRSEDKHYINLFTKKIKDEIQKKISAP